MLCSLTFKGVGYQIPTKKDVHLKMFNSFSLFLHFSKVLKSGLNITQICNFSLRYVEYNYHIHRQFVMKDWDFNLSVFNADIWLEKILPYAFELNIDQCPANKSSSLGSGRPSIPGCQLCVYQEVEETTDFPLCCLFGPVSLGLPTLPSLEDSRRSCPLLQGGVPLKYRYTLICLCNCCAMIGHDHQPCWSPNFHCPLIHYSFLLS